MTPSLLIVDDHESFRGFVRTMLSADGFDVTGEAEDGESGLAAVDRLAPDVVLLDVQLPGIDGFEVARRIRAAGRRPQIVLTSSRDATAYGERLARSGADGFIPKQDLSAAALAAILARA